MKNKGFVALILLLCTFLVLTSCDTGMSLSVQRLDASINPSAQKNNTSEHLLFSDYTDWIITPEWLTYHYIVIDDDGNILPWYNPDNLGDSYDHVLHLVFDWWLNMPANPGEPNLPFYLMHRIWRAAPDYYVGGIGGDQLAMAMSSWRLFYDYTGDTRATGDMVLMANHVLSNGLSASTDEWPYLPYPYNYSSLDAFDGDMMAGVGYTQPDKAGSFGLELLNLYKITNDNTYLQAAINIANTLAAKTQDGDYANSPLPYRVHTASSSVAASYTTNYAGLLMLWEALIDLGQGNLSSYQLAHAKILTWLHTYPVQNHRWGPFFEDVGNWSDTQINAVTMAMYMMEHPQIWGSSWQQDARSAMDWAIQELGNNYWSAFGVQVMNEQTGYRVPGNSHTSRQASMELRYAELTGDTSQIQNAIRQLNWATYMVDVDGKNYYPYTDIWLTDGYGDYVRHYLRAMAAAPYLAPANQDHLLRTSSVIENISYQQAVISYHTFDTHSVELLRVNTFTPLVVTAGGQALPRLAHISDLDLQEGYTLGADSDLPSVLRIRHDNAAEIVISGTIDTSVGVVTGWNMVVVPVQAASMQLNVLFPDIVPPAYNYTSCYQAVLGTDTLVTGRGYWMYFTSAHAYAIRGLPVSPKNIPVNAGWNMIGPFDTPVLVSAITSTPAGILSLPLYGYTNGYSEATKLLPGAAYWAYATQAGTLHLSGGVGLAMNVPRASFR
jgi:hypothetical protein